MREIPAKDAKVHGFYVLYYNRYIFVDEVKIGIKSEVSQP